MPFLRPTHRSVLLAGAVIAGAGLVAYADSFTVPFVFQDVPAIVDNPTIRHWWDLGRVLSPPTEGGMTAGGRPLVNLSLAINYAWGGTSVVGYHAFNLAVHLLAGLVLFGIVRRSLLTSAAGSPAGPDPTLAALAVALWWTLHPLQTESVTYVVQRAESLMGLFYLLTLYGFIRYASTAAATPSGGKSGAFFWATFAVVACLLGMATKEVMVSAPVMVFLYDRTFVSGSFRKAWREHGRFHLSLVATWLLLGCLALGTGERGGTAGFGIGVSWWAYLLTQFPAIAHYLRLALWPQPLIFDYGAEWVKTPWTVLPAAGLVAGLAGLTAYGLFSPGRGPRSAATEGPAGSRALAFLGVWFFAILAPTSLVPGMSQTMAEHRMYLALIPVLVVVAWGAWRWLGRTGFLFFFPIAALALGAATWTRNQDYRSDLSLWADTAAKRPGHARAQVNLGNALLTRGRVSEAVARYEEALRVEPDSPEAHNSLGNAWVEAGQLPQAVGEYERALRRRPNYSEAENDLGYALFRLGESDRAMVHFRAALRLRPDYPDAHYNLGLALAFSGRIPEAIPQFGEAVRLDPSKADFHNNLAVALASTGHLPEAIEQYEEVLKLRPDSAEGQNNLGAAWAEAGRWPEAIAHYQEALRLQPGFAKARSNLGLAFANTGRLPEALVQLEQALRLDPGAADAHYNIGLALRALGRADEAKFHFDEAERLQRNSP